MAFIWEALLITDLTWHHSIRMTCNVTTGNRPSISVLIQDIWSRVFVQNLTTNIISGLTWHKACIDIIRGVLFHNIIEIWLTVGVCWLFVTRAWQALFKSECILAPLLSSVVRWGICWSLMLIYASRAWLDLTILQVLVLIDLLKFWIVASISIRNSDPTHFLMSLDERF